MVEEAVDKSFIQYLKAVDLTVIHVIFYTGNWRDPCGAREGYFPRKCGVTVLGMHAKKKKGTSLKYIQKLFFFYLTVSILLNESHSLQTPSGFIAAATIISHSSWMLSLNYLIPLPLTHCGQRFSLPNSPHMPLMSPQVFASFPPQYLLQPGNMCPQANTSLSPRASTHT